MTWRPIETVPDNGSPFLAYVPGGVEVPGYWWEGGGPLHVIPCRWKTADQASDDSGFWASCMGIHEFGPYDDPSADWVGVAIRPTHWMPFPDAPAQHKPDDT